MKSEHGDTSISYRDVIIDEIGTRRHVDLFSGNAVEGPMPHANTGQLQQHVLYVNIADVIGRPGSVGKMIYFYYYYLHSYTRLTLISLVRSYGYFASSI